MIPSINNYSSINFQGFHTVKKPVISNELSYNIMLKLNPAKKAVNEILNQIKNTAIKDKTAKVLSEYNIALNRGITFNLSDKSVSLNADEENLNITVQNADFSESVFYIKNNELIKSKNSKNKHFTEKEIKNAENHLDKILTEIDFPLLKLRTSFLPETKHTTPISLPEVLISETKASEPVINPVIKEPPPETVKEVIITEESVIPTKVKRPLPKGMINTSDEVDNLLRKILLNDTLKPTKFSPVKYNNGVGRLNPKCIKLLQEVANLFEQISNNCDGKASTLKKLKKNFPKYAKIRRNSSITLKNPENKTEITFAKTKSKRFQNNNLFTIYKTDSKGKITEIVPILGNKILRMQKRFNTENSVKFVNYISTIKCLNQQEIDSKNIPTILTILQTELKEILDFLPKKTPGMINENLVNKIKNSNQKIMDFKKTVQLNKYKHNNYELTNDGSCKFKKINPQDVSISFLPAQNNKNLQDTTVIRVLHKRGGLIDGFAIKDNKIIKGYPRPFREVVPKKLNFYTNEEIKELGLEEKIDNYLEILNQQTDMMLETMKSFKDIRDLLKRGF